ncbi:MAG: hypothetical protein IJ714_04055 [Bacteroidales bacterium]|nr:hypothetical protein [Bacteroidales bacterium]
MMTLFKNQYESPESASVAFSPAPILAASDHVNSSVFGGEGSPGTIGGVVNEGDF